MRRLRPVLLPALIVAACHPSHDPTTEPRGEIVTVAPPVDAAVFSVVDAGVDASRVAETDAPGEVGYASDGTLLVVGKKVLLARSAAGELARYRLPAESAVEIATPLRGVVVRTETNATLLATPTLAVLYDGPGTPLQGSANVVVVEHDQALAFQNGDALGRLVLSNGLDAARSLRLVAHGTRADVTFELATDNGIGASATLFDVATGRALGRGVPVSSSYATLPVGALLETIGFTIEGRSVARFDLEKGTVVQRRTVACRRDDDLANPTPSPNGDLLVVTCGQDAVVLDGATLALRRRITHVIPGCDNGPYLGGEILSDGRTLRLDGCGGEAKLDLQTGKYACADDPGLLGAPYDPVPMPSARIGAPGGPRVPAGREHVPRCAHGDGQTSPLGDSGRYHREESDPPAVVFDGGSISVAGGTAYSVAIAPDESAIAYARDDKVVVRSLPDGKVVAELALIAP